MFTPVELFIGIRYIHARRGHHFIAFVSMTAIVATALGMAVLLTILSIMNGFEGELRGRILGMAAHVDVGVRQHTPLAWQDELASLAKRPGVAALAPYVRRDVLLVRAGVLRAVELRGVVPRAELAATSLSAHMLDGDVEDLQPGGYGLVIGRELAEAMQVGVGDAVTVMSPRPLVTPAGPVPRLKRFTVRGVFEFGLQEHDGSLILAHIDDAARLFRLGQGIDGIRVQLEAPEQAQRFKEALRETTDSAVTDWTDTHRNLFRALKMEKIAMFVILALAIAIAAFNLVSVLVVAVTEKRGDIAMLQALGLDRRLVTRVFVYQGAITGVLGVTGGLVLGYLRERGLVR